MNVQRNCYEVLGLTADATGGEIKKKYRELARKFHPDVVQDKTQGLYVFMQISQAYHVLGHADRRTQYNFTLQNAAVAALITTAPAPCAPPCRPRPFAAILNRAENALMAWQPAEARAFCLHVLEADPDHAQARGLLGDALVQMSRPEEAAIQYRRALKITPCALIQAKLNRAAPGDAAPGMASPPPSLPADTKKAAGLFGRFLSRKQPGRNQKARLMSTGDAAE